MGEGERYMTDLEAEYPDIAKQRWNLYRKIWARALNVLIKNEEERNIGARIN